jgi:hypothetical protein
VFISQTKQKQLQEEEEAKRKALKQDQARRYQELKVKMMAEMAAQKPDRAGMTRKFPLK